MIHPDQRTILPPIDTDEDLPPPKVPKLLPGWDEIYRPYELGQPFAIVIAMLLAFTSAWTCITLILGPQNVSNFFTQLIWKGVAPAEPSNPQAAITKHQSVAGSHGTPFDPVPQQHSKAVAGLFGTPNDPVPPSLLGHTDIDTTMTLHHDIVPAAGLCGVPHNPATTGIITLIVTTATGSNGVPCDPATVFLPFFSIPDAAPD